MESKRDQLGDAIKEVTMKGIEQINSVATQAITSLGTLSTEAGKIATATVGSIAKIPSATEEAVRAGLSKVTDDAKATTDNFVVELKNLLEKARPDIQATRRALEVGETIEKYESLLPLYEPYGEGRRVDYRKVLPILREILVRFAKSDRCKEVAPGFHGGALESD